MDLIYVCETYRLSIYVWDICYLSSLSMVKTKWTTCGMISKLNNCLYSHMLCLYYSARYVFDYLLLESCTCWLAYKMLEYIDPRWCAPCSNAMLIGCTYLGGAYIHFINYAQFQFLCKSYVVIKKPKRGRLKEHISLSKWFWCWWQWLYSTNYFIIIEGCVNDHICPKVEELEVGMVG